MNLEAYQRQVESAWMFHDIQDKNLQRLAGLIGRERSRILHGSGRRPSHCLPILALPEEILASLTLQTILEQFLRADSSVPPTYSAVTQAIGDRCYWSWKALAAAGVALRDIVELLSERHKSRNRKKRI